MPDVPQQLRPINPGGTGTGDSDPAATADVDFDGTALQQEIAADVAVLPASAADTGEADFDDGEVYPVTKITYESSRYNQSALLATKLLADRYPEQDEIVMARINETPIGSGRVDVSSPTDDGLVSIDSYDAIRRLKQGTVTADFQGVPIENVVTVVCAFADVAPSEVDLGFNTNIYASYMGRSCAGVLDDLAHRVRGTWYADPTAPAGQPIFTNNENLAVDRHEIKHILPDTDPGLQTAPYDGVRVTGGGTVTGASRVYSAAKDPVTAVAGDTSSGDRVYEHEDKSIQSTEVAQRTAHSLLDEFERQQNTGQIKLVGDERIQPLDTVIMPDGLGGAEYLASEVTHEISASDGFVTTIQVGGLIDGEVGGSEDVRGPGTPTP